MGHIDVRLHLLSEVLKVGGLGWGGMRTLSSFSRQVIFGFIALSSVSPHYLRFHSIGIGFITLSSISRVINMGWGGL